MLKHKILIEIKLMDVKASTTHIRYKATIKKNKIIKIYKEVKFTTMNVPN